MPATPPSGQQHRLRRGRLEATVVEVSGGLRSLLVGDRELLDGYGVDEICTAARGQQLIPWPNRVRDGRYSFAGRQHQLALTEPAQGHAIHGLARWANWNVEARSAANLVMALELHPQPGYPWVLSLRTEYALEAGGLRVTMSARNLSEAACPAGLGMHPYLRPPGGSLDVCRLRLPASTEMIGDERQIPTGWRAVDGGANDFREPRLIGGTAMDLGFTDLLRDDGGLARIELRGPGGDGSAVWLDRGFGHLMIFTGDKLPPAERRRGLGVEPMTCAPDAFNNGRDLVVLEAGQELSASYGIEPL